jgi:glycosyltransferase involved in cell wall biosynthesis
VPTPATSLHVHVLIDSLTWGGAEMLLADLAAGAPSAAIELSVGYLNELHGSPAAVRLRAQGIEPELVGVARMLDPRALPRLRAHLARVRPDVVHTHLQIADVLGLLAARSLHLPCVSTIHLLASQPTGHEADSSARGVAKARLAALVRRHAGARVIAVSDAAREAYLQTGWDVAHRVVTVHNGIARAPGEGAGQQVRRELGIEPDALVLSTVSVLRAGKGHEVVFEAVRGLLTSFPGLRLIVLGDGPERERIEKLAGSLDTTVIFPGHHGDVMSVLAATDVLVHPTLMDAFPTALLEAAAAGVPVIATAVGGIPEIIENGRTGFLIDAPPSPVELAERLEPLLGDARTRLEMGAHAHERFIERFTAEHWVKHLRGVYEEVLREHAR